MFASVPITFQNWVSNKKTGKENLAKCSIKAVLENYMKVLGHLFGNVEICCILGFFKRCSCCILDDLEVILTSFQLSSLGVS